MTLRCECGGALVLQDMKRVGAHDAFESYECGSCGRKGTYQMVSGDEHATGCVTVGVVTP